MPLTAGNVAASVQGICATYRLGPRDATVLVMPLYHGHGLIAGLLATLASGGAAWLPAARRFAASRFWTEMVEIGATWYTAVPTMHQILLQRAAAEYPRTNPPRLRFIRSCSAPLAPAVFHQLEAEFAAPVVPAYGMTETAHQTTSNPLPQFGPVKAGSVGVATGTEIRIAGPDGQAAEPGTPGEVCVRGPAVAHGYLDDPKSTAKTFVDGWLHTGDLGYLDGDGYLFLSGRSKELINRGGEKFSPQQIDAVLLSHRPSRMPCPSASRTKSTAKRSTPRSSSSPDSMAMSVPSRLTVALNWVKQEPPSESFSSPSSPLRRRMRETAANWRPNSAHLKPVDLLATQENRGPLPLQDSSRPAILLSKERGMRERLLTISAKCHEDKYK